MVAGREVWEETGEQLSASSRQRIEQGGAPVAWEPKSKYALFCAELAEEDATLVDRVASLGDRPSPVHDANLHGVAWEPLWYLLDVRWCKRHLHQFALAQADAIRPVVRRLHAASSVACGVDAASDLLARVALAEETQPGNEGSRAPAEASAVPATAVPPERARRMVDGSSKLNPNATSFKMNPTAPPFVPALTTPAAASPGHPAGPQFASSAPPAGHSAPMSKTVGVGCGVDGLTLFDGAVSAEQQRELLAHVDTWVADGAAGRLAGKSYEAPPADWIQSGQGRVAILFGIHVKCNKVDNAAVEPIPHVLLGLLDQFETAGIFAVADRPDTCCVNIYELGSWLPPHVDSEAFERPFCTLSLLSPQRVIFGEAIDGHAGEWSGQISVMMPPGSVLRVAGTAAGPAWKHALPRATARRVSLTFRKLGAAKREYFEAIRAASAEAAEARRARRREEKEARGWRPAPLREQSSATAKPTSYVKS